MTQEAGYTLGQLSEALGTTLDGDASRVVRGVAPLETAGPHEISFVTDARYRNAARTSRAGAFLAPPDVDGLPGPVLRSPSPRLTLIDLIALFHPPARPVPGIATSAVVAPDARVAPSASVGALAVIDAGAVVGEGVQIHPLVYVGPGAVIGDGSVLYPHVVVRDRVTLGRRVIVHPGAVIGADGFGYVRAGAAYRKLPQVGGVRVEDDVEIGANTTIDRGMLGDTVVRRGTKIDNLVQVAHNVEVGEDAILAAQVGIAGSSRVGRGAVLLGQVGVADHVTVGEGAVLGAQCGVAQDVPAGERLTGTWGRPMAQARRIWLAQADLPDLLRRVKTLERRLEELAARVGGEGSVK